MVWAAVIYGAAATPAYAAPDPGGDPAAAVPLPPPAGKLMGFNDDSAAGLHGLSPTDYAELSRTAGGNLIRSSLDWRDAEPQEDVWRAGSWARWQELYDAALARGMRPLFTIGFAPSWARDDAGRACGEGCRLPPAPAMDGEWAEFAAEVARRFPEAVIEVWNEPNLVNFWNSGPDAARLADLIVGAAEAIEAVSPRTTVIAGGLSNVQSAIGGHVPLRTYVGRLFAAEPALDDQIDALSFHPYPGGAALGAGSLFAKSFEDVRSALAAADAGSEKLFVSEVGVSVGPPELLSQGAQAQTSLELYRRAMTMPDVLGIVFHRLIEPGDIAGIASWELGAGWLRYGASPPAPRAVFCEFAARAGNPYPGCPDPPRTPDSGTAAGGDTDPPQTRIERRDKRGARQAFALLADEPATFECRFGPGRYRSCGERVRRSSAGGRCRLRALFARAIDAAGNVDPTAAKRRVKSGGCRP